MDSFEYFDHTADIGMRVQAATLAELLQTAGRGLAYLIVPDLNSIALNEVRVLIVRASEPDYVVFDLLTELIYLFETEKLVCPALDVQVGDAETTARVRGERFDPDRHPVGHELKAVTYHALRVEQTPSGWTAEVIFDI